MKGLASLAFHMMRPALHALDAETAHQLTLASLRASPCLNPQAADPQLCVDAFGLRFPNPIGLAAGFDKNAEVPTQILGLGFGFVEVGTTTPLAQTGNPKPRLFRLAEDRAVINRMGFNNDGHAAMLQRLTARKRQGIVGVNIGVNKDAADRIEDYVAGVKTLGPMADYLTVNVSSPNTPGLRALQGAEDLTRLLDRVNDARAHLSRRVPVLLKIAPDLDHKALGDIAGLCISRVDGVIISNTTVSRPSLRSVDARESGGLSGEPLFDLATRALAAFHRLTDGCIPLIGVGGIHDVETAYAKFAAGASLIQIYSALVYEGPGLIARITSGLKSKLGQRTISEIVGRDVHRYQMDPGK